MRLCVVVKVAKFKQTSKQIKSSTIFKEKVSRNSTEAQNNQMNFICFHLKLRAIQDVNTELNHYENSKKMFKKSFF